VIRAVYDVVSGKPVSDELKWAAPEIEKLLTEAPESLADVTNFSQDGEYLAGPEYLR
jgi:hypothetical protein